MRVLFNPDDGEVFYTVPDRDWFMFDHKTNIPLAEFLVDELLPDNKGICLDLYKVQGRKDASGQGKYFLTQGANGWELHQRDGWEEMDEQG